MKNVENKREKEKRIVSLMIEIYCMKNHGGKELCQECKELKEYAMMRTDKCPFMESKTFCSNCKVHCYKPDMQQRIRQVMRFSGPRIMFYHPILATKHIFESRQEKRSLG